MTASTSPTVSRPAGSSIWPWVLLLGVVAGALTFGAVRARPPATDTERVAAIANRIKCPACIGESAGTSAVKVSQEIRLDIAKRLDAGETEAQIEDYYRGKYGDDVLLTPPASGVAALVWALPVAAFVCAVAGLAAAFRRWRLAPDGPVASAADTSLVDEALRNHAALTPDAAPIEGES